MSEASYSIPRHPDHAATVRQQGLHGDWISVRAVCPCRWLGFPYVGRAGQYSGKLARRRAEQDVRAHRRGMG